MSNIPEATVGPAHEYKSSDISVEMIKVEDKERKEIHYLLVDLRCSKHRVDGPGVRAFYDASLKIDVRYIFGSRLSLIGSRISDMGASINGFDRSVKLTNGSVMIDIDALRGLHIGTYLFYKVVDWAKNNAPGFRIVPIGLSSVDAKPENRDRRNSFYEHFGLKFEYITEKGVEKSSGRSLATLTTDDLVAYQNWPNIKSERVYDGLEKLAYEVRRMRWSLTDARKGLRAEERRRRRKESKLGILARCINWPMYLMIAFLAFAAGKAIGH